MRSRSRTYYMVLAYDGSNYAGWQFQPDAVSIQELLETALHQVTQQQVRVIASGRTDAGVHAMGQVASFRLETELEIDVLQRAINANTSRDICVRSLRYARHDFHAIRDAVSKRYRYQVQDGPLQDPLQRRFSWFVPTRLNHDAMSEAAAFLLGEHDFRSFEASGSERASSVRTIEDIFVRRETEEPFPRITLEVAADGFLYNMVRNMVGSLAEVGRGVQSPSWIEELLRLRDRKHAGPTAPPHGLMLVDVTYPPSVLDTQEA